MTSPTPSCWCNARLPAGGTLSYVCTLEKGHRGDHKAHGERNVVLKTWPQMPKEMHAEEPDR